jgi:8-oxo-dGTP diphosphatase
VAREILEETGVGVVVGPVVEVLDRIEKTADGRVEYHFVIIDYVCYAATGTLACGSDADAAEWVTPEELPAYRLTAKAASVIDKAITLAASTGNIPARPAAR